MRVFRSTPVLVEAALPGLSKARGLARLAAHLGIKREETMAIGDDDNDAEMLAWAGLGVAMVTNSLALSLKWNTFKAREFVRAMLPRRPKPQPTTSPHPYRRMAQPRP